MGVLQAGQIPLKAAGTDASVVGAELVVLDTEGRVIRALNPTGARIWELIDGRRSLGEIAALLAGEFRIPADRALQDVTPFVAQLASKRLLSFNAGDQR